MAIKDYIPCFVLDLFRIDDGNGRCASARMPTQEQRDAWSFYNTITTSPTAPIEFFVNGPNGSRVKRTVTMQAMMSLGNNYQSSAARLQSLIDGAIAQGWLTRRKPTENEAQALLTDKGAGKAWPSRGQAKRDHSFAYCEEMLQFPQRARDGRMANPQHPANPNLVPSWYPQLNNGVEALYPTSRMNDPSQTTNQQLIDFYRDIITAVVDFDKDRNAVTMFHPLTILARAPFFLDPATYTYLQPDMQSYLNEWRQDNGNANYLIVNNSQGVTFLPGDPERASVVFQYASTTHWLNSLYTREPIATHYTGTTLSRGVNQDGEVHRTWSVLIADAQLEIVRWANMANVRLQTSNAARDAKAVFVDMFACQALYKRLLTRAYEQSQRPFGSSLVAYSNELKKESDERKRLARSQAIGAVVDGYESTGDDASDITSYCIGSVGLLVKAAVTAGPEAAIAMGVMLVASGLFAFLSSPESLRDRTVESLRVSDGGPIASGLSPLIVTESWPLHRVATAVRP